MLITSGNAKLIVFSLTTLCILDKEEEKNETTMSLSCVFVHVLSKMPLKEKFMGPQIGAHTPRGLLSLHFMFHYGGLHHKLSI